MKLRFVCISDTHLSHPKLPKGDVLIHTGDATYTGALNEFESFNSYMDSQDFKYKIFVAGNHELSLDTEEDIGYLSEDIIRLHNQQISIEGINIYGTSIQPFFNCWAFNVKSDEERYKIYKQIPENTDILLTHCPPFGILDKEPYIYRSLPQRFGCHSLLKRINELDNLKVHVFGHIHAGYGTKRKNKKVYINAAIMNQHYAPTNKPIVFDYINGEIKVIRNPAE